MEEIKKEKLKDLLIRLKKVNGVYKKATEEQKGRLLEASEKTIKDLLEFGFNRDFLIGLIIGGKDFLESLGNVKGLDANQSGELIFR